MELRVVTGWLNRTGGCTVSVMAHEPGSVRLCMRVADTEAVETLRVGDEVPLMPGWHVKTIMKPRPRAKQGAIDGTGWLVAVLDHD